MKFVLALSPEEQKKLNEQTLAKQGESGSTIPSERKKVTTKAAIPNPFHDPKHLLTNDIGHFSKEELSGLATHHKTEAENEDLADSLRKAHVEANNKVVKELNKPDKKIGMTELSTEMPEKKVKAPHDWRDLSHTDLLDLYDKAKKEHGFHPLLPQIKNVLSNLHLHTGDLSNLDTNSLQRLNKLFEEQKDITDTKDKNTHERIKKALEAKKIEKPVPSQEKDSEKKLKSEDYDIPRETSEYPLNLGNTEEPTEADEHERIIKEEKEPIDLDAANPQQIKEHAQKIVDEANETPKGSKERETAKEKILKLQEVLKQKTDFLRERPSRLSDEDLEKRAKYHEERLKDDPRHKLHLNGVRLEQKNRKKDLETLNKEDAIPLLKVDPSSLSNTDLVKRFRQHRELVNNNQDPTGENKREYDKLGAIIKDRLKSKKTRGGDVFLNKLKDNPQLVQKEIPNLSNNELQELHEHYKGSTEHPETAKLLEQTINEKEKKKGNIDVVHQKLQKQYVDKLIANPKLLTDKVVSNLTPEELDTVHASIDKSKHPDKDILLQNAKKTKKPNLLKQIIGFGRPSKKIDTLEEVPLHEIPIAELHKRLTEAKKGTPEHKRLATVANSRADEYNKYLRIKGKKNPASMTESELQADINVAKRKAKEDPTKAKLYTLHANKLQAVLDKKTPTEAIPNAEIIEPEAPKTLAQKMQEHHTKNEFTAPSEHSSHYSDPVTDPEEGVNKHLHALEKNLNIDRGQKENKRLVTGTNTGHVLGATAALHLLPEPLLRALQRNNPTNARFRVNMTDKVKEGEHEEALKPGESRLLGNTVHANLPTHDNIHKDMNAGMRATAEGLSTNILNMGKDNPKIQSAINELTEEATRLKIPVQTHLANILHNYFAAGTAAQQEEGHVPTLKGLSEEGRANLLNTFLSKHPALRKIIGHKRQTVGNKDELADAELQKKLGNDTQELHNRQKASFLHRKIAEFSKHNENPHIDLKEQLPKILEAEKKGQRVLDIGNSNHLLLNSKDAGGKHEVVQEGSPNVDDRLLKHVLDGTTLKKGDEARKVLKWAENAPKTDGRALIGGNLVLYNHLGHPTNLIRGFNHLPQKVQDLVLQHHREEYEQGHHDTDANTRTLEKPGSLIETTPYKELKQYKQAAPGGILNSTVNKIGHGVTKDEAGNPVGYVIFDPTRRDRVLNKNKTSFINSKSILHTFKLPENEGEKKKAIAKLQEMGDKIHSRAKLTADREKIIKQKKDFKEHVKSGINDLTSKNNIRTGRKVRIGPAEFVGKSMPVDKSYDQLLDSHPVIDGKGFDYEGKDGRIKFFGMTDPKKNQVVFQKKGDKWFALPRTVKQVEDMSKGKEGVEEVKTEADEKPDKIEETPDKFHQTYIDSLKTPLRIMHDTEGRHETQEEGEQRGVDIAEHNLKELSDKEIKEVEDYHKQKPSRYGNRILEEINKYRQGKTTKEAPETVKSVQEEAANPPTRIEPTKEEAAKPPEKIEPTEVKTNNNPFHAHFPYSKLVTLYDEGKKTAPELAGALFHTKTTDNTKDWDDGIAVLKELLEGKVPNNYRRILGKIIDPTKL